MQELSIAIDLLQRGMRGNRFISVGKKDVTAYARMASLLKVNSSRLHEAYDHCHAALKLVPDHFMATRELGDVLLRMKRYEEAEVELERAVRLDSSRYSAHWLLGVAYMQTRQLVKAESSLRKALVLGQGRESYASIVLHYGIVLEKKGDLEQAELVWVNTYNYELCVTSFY